jgi:hypothetical protein
MNRSRSLSSAGSASGVKTDAGPTTPEAQVVTKIAPKKKPRSLMRITVAALVLVAIVLWWRAQPEGEAVAAGANLLEKAAKALPAIEPKPEPPLAESPTPEAEPAPTVPAAAAGDGDEEAEDLSDAALAAADEALNDTQETEVSLPAPANEAKVNSLAEVKALIAKGQVDAAIRGIQQLRRQQPKNAQLPLMLGNLYIDKNWWSDGLAKYREAIGLSSGLKKNARIQRDAIKALGVDKVYARARALLVRDIGRSALPALRRAASHDASKDVRKRAASVAKQLAR